MYVSVDNRPLAVVQNDVCAPLLHFPVPLCIHLFALLFPFSPLSLLLKSLCLFILVRLGGCCCKHASR